MRSTRWFQSGKMASVSRATLCRSVVHGVTGSQNRPSGANRAAKSSGPSIDSKVRAQASQSRSAVPLLRAHRFRPFPWLLLRRLSASKVTTASSSGRTI